MNIYLDIDGVLLANDAQAANYAPEFIDYVLTNYPDSTYWLTTHCNGDASQPLRNIGHLFDDKTVELMKSIKLSRSQYNQQPVYSRIYTNLQKHHPSDNCGTTTTSMNG